MRRQSDRLRRYSPLTGALAAALLAAFVLPSALNVPQSNPTQTLEFAPVPPEDDTPPPPPSGNVAAVGLGESVTAPTGDAAGGDGEGAGLPPPPPVPEGAGERPVTKRCVGDPPRQTEDPLSPPCVAHFEGDNFGDTYQGVTGEEITILIYRDASCSTGAARPGQDCPPADRYFDLSQPETPEDPVDVRLLRIWQRHFNERYQTYGRFVRFWVYYDRQDPSRSPEGRRADAIENVETLDPFAVLAYPASFQTDYLVQMADLGVLNFGSLRARPAEFYTRHAGLIWSYLPSIEEQARNFAAFVCRRVIGYPATAAGDIDGDDVADTDRPRRLGFLRTEADWTPELLALAKEVRAEIEGCGGEFAATGTYPVPGALESTDNQLPATRNMAQFQQEGVTTIIWPGGHETEHSEAAGRQGYYPEWVLLGDGQFEGFGPTLFQDQHVWHEHAWPVTPVAAIGTVEESRCYYFMYETAPEAPEQDRSYGCGLRTYFEDLRQLFTGIQVAGPRLTPDTIDQGFHAIPGHVSPEPNTPACFYRPGDYTCVKDATYGWWDRSGTNSEGLDGCYRMVDGGQRHHTDSWPADNALTDPDPADPCLGYQGNAGYLDTPAN